MKFSIPVIPTAKGRGRSFGYNTSYGIGIGVYTPEKTRTAEAEIKKELKKLYTDEPISVPIAVIFTFFMPIPASESERRKGLLDYNPHIKKPDLDNLVKLVKDAGNKLLWRDDSIIFQTVSMKVYSHKPHIEIDILYEPAFPLPVKGS